MWKGKSSHLFGGAAVSRGLPFPSKGGMRKGEWGLNVKSMQIGRQNSPSFHLWVVSFGLPFPSKGEEGGSEGDSTLKLAQIGPAEFSNFPPVWVRWFRSVQFPSKNENLR